MSVPSPMRGIKAGPDLDHSPRPEGWPKGLRRIESFHFLVDHERRLVQVIANRMNRGTGYTDPINLGAMTMADFKAMAEHAADLAAGRDNAPTLIERLTGYKPEEAE